MIQCKLGFRDYPLSQRSGDRSGSIFNIAGSIIATVYTKRIPFSRLLLFLFFNMITLSIIKKEKSPSFIYSLCSNSALNAVRRMPLNILQNIFQEETEDLTAIGTLVA